MSPKPGGIQSWTVEENLKSWGPTPQRQCAWLLSTYLKEGEEQKEVLEARDDEEKESEVDGEVEEGVSQRVHER